MPFKPFMKKAKPQDDEAVEAPKSVKMPKLSTPPTISMPKDPMPMDIGAKSKSHWRK